MRKEELFKKVTVAMLVASISWGTSPVESILYADEYMAEDEFEEWIEEEDWSEEEEWEDEFDEEESVDEYPEISDDMIKIRPGEDYVLDVSGEYDEIIWSSSKKSVVSVDDYGVVTAKKKGTAYVKAVVISYIDESTDEDLYEGEETEGEDDWEYTEESEDEDIWEDAVETESEDIWEDEEDAWEDEEDVWEDEEDDTEMEVDTNNPNVVKYVLKCKVIVKKGAVNTSSASSIKGSIKFKKAKVTLKVGKAKKLKVVGKKGKISWKSTRAKIATVKKGKVKALKAGKTTIIAIMGNKAIKCKVTVK